jgi:Family of unknown function (DUF5678)
MSENDDLRAYMEQMRVFIPNRQAFPLEELEKYAGQWVAWSPDGTHIVAASSESPEAVEDAVVAAGHDPEKCVFSYVPGLDEHFI